MSGVSLGLEELLEGDGEPKATDDTTTASTTVPTTVERLRVLRETVKARRDEIAAEKQALREEEEAAEEVVEAKEKEASSSLPRTLGPSAHAPNAIPWDAFQRLGEPTSYARLREEINRKVRRLKKISLSLPSRCIAAWWSPTGGNTKEDIQKALPVSWQSEMLDTPFKDGVYYVQVLSSSGEESPGDTYLICPMTRDRDDPEDKPTSTADAALKGQIGLMRANETLEANLKESEKRLRDERKDNDSLRSDLRDALDENAELSRHVAALEAEVETLKAAGEPFLDKDAADTLAAQGFTVLNQWLSDPNKGAREYIDKQRQLLLKMFEGIHFFLNNVVEYDDILELMVRGKAGDVLWDPLVRLFNESAEYGKREERALPASKLVPLLPAHVEDISDDAILAAAEAKVREAEVEVTGVKRKVETLKAQLAEYEEIVGRQEKAMARMKKKNGKTDSLVVRKRGAS